MNFVLLLKTFLLMKSSYCSPATLKKYQEDCEAFLQFLPAASPELLPDGFSPFQEYIIHLRKLGKRTVTIRSYARSVKSFLRWAYESEYLPDYLRGVKLPRDDSRPKLPLYADEVTRIDEFLTLRDWLIFHLMLDSGLRRQEVIHLQVEHLIPERNVLQILDSKGNKSRFVLIPDCVLDKLQYYLKLQRISSGYVFRSGSGTPLTDNTIKMLFQHLKKRSGVDRLHAHLLRHTFATSYLLGGGNLEFLRVFMGHYDYTVTKNYSSLAAQMKMLGADVYKLDSIWFTRGY